MRVGMDQPSGTRSIHGAALCFAMLALLLCAACAKTEPAAAAAGAATSPAPMLIHTPMLTPTPTPMPSPTPVLTPTPVPTPFSILWLTDTQGEAYYRPERFAEMGEWIASHIEEKNIVQVVQTGDLVESGIRQKEWDAFYTLYDQIAGKVPYITIAGNHDIGVKLCSYDGYLSQRFLDELPEEQKHEGGKAVYTLLDAGGEQFIILGSGYMVEEECAPWLNALLEAHPDHTAILLQHSYLNAKRGIRGEGTRVRELVVAKNPNIRLVLCGHYRGTRFLADAFDDDGDGICERTVNTMLFNYQSYEGNGAMRLLTFDPVTRSIQVDSFTSSDRPLYDSTMKKNPFTIEDAF